MKRIDWSDDNLDWGNHVTFAANGSWVLDAHGEEVTQS